LVEHDMRVVAASDWVIDIGPGAGEEGGRVVAAGTVVQLSLASQSRTAPFLSRSLGLAYGAIPTHPLERSTSHPSAEDS
jgi:excinuclease ABC subunit A